MKRTLIISVLAVCASWLGAQITTNTNFKINSNNPIDNRMTIATLGDTSTISFPFEGLLVHVNDADSYYKYNGATWEVFDPGGGGSVSSVNSQTGVVVLDADDIDDSSTTNKFTTAAEITKLSNIANYATNENHIYYIVGLGQSNMEGRDGNPGTDARILIGNPSGTTSVWNPSDNNPLHAFAVEWINKNPKDTLVCFHVAASGISISEFYPSTNTYWTALDTMLENHSNPYVSAVLWMQGERDRDNSGISVGISGGEADTLYYNKWQDSIYTNIVAEPWFDNRRPVIVGLTYDGPGADYSGITRNAALARIGTDTIPWTLYADSDQLTTIDSLHFTDASYTRVGQLMYEAYKAAPYYVPQSASSVATVILGDSLRAIVDTNYLNTHYSYTVNTSLSIGSSLASDFTAGWNSDPQIDTLNGIKYIRILAGTDDSTFVNANVNMVELPTTRSLSANGASIRFKFVHTGTSRHGIVMQLHNATGGGNGWLWQVKADDGIELFRVENGVASSKASNSIGTIFTEGTEDEFISRMVGDSLIQFINSTATDTVVAYYVIPLAERFSNQNGIGISSNWAASGTTGYFRDLQVYDTDKNPFALPDPSKNQMSFVNNGNVVFTEESDNVISANVDLSAAGTDDQTAVEVNYDNSTSGLSASNVKVAIDETVGLIPDNIADLTISADVDLSSQKITNLTPGTATTDAATYGQLTASHALDLIAGADGDTIVLDTRETLLVLDGGVGDPATFYIDGSALSSGAKLYIKYGGFSGNATIDRDDDNDPGNFLATGTTSGSTTLVFTGTGTAMLLKSGATWYQMY